MPPSRTHASPDAHGAGLVKHALNPLRYDGQTDDPHEAPGILKAFMPEKVRVLDVGCGTGVVTVIANQGKHNDVLAVEPDVNRAAIARSRGVNVVCGFMDQDFLDQTGLFDVIVFADVLEHLVVPDDMLRLAIGGLKPDGLILVSVPNVAHWSIRLKLLFGKFDYRETGICDATHLRWFTQRSVRDLLEQQKFEIIKMKESAGTTLAVYQSSFFKLAPEWLRRRFVHSMTRAFPRLFGCQFVIKARKFV